MALSSAFLLNLYFFFFLLQAEGKQKKTEAKKGSNKRYPIFHFHFYYAVRSARLFDRCLISDRPEGACGVDPIAQHVPPDKASEAAHSSDTAENKVRERKNE